MATVTVKIEGLRELDAALGQLTKATAKGVLKRVLTEAGEPVARTWRGIAPKLEGYYTESIDVGTKLSRRQASLHKAEGGRAFQEMFIGSTNPAAVQQEFGNSRHPPQPSGRPAWDAKKTETLEYISNALWAEISKTAARVAKRAARGK